MSDIHQSSSSLTSESEARLRPQRTVLQGIDFAGVAQQFYQRFHGSGGDRALLSQLIGRRGFLLGFAGPQLSGMAPNFVWPSCDLFFRMLIVSITFKDRHC